MEQFAAARQIVSVSAGANGGERGEEEEQEEGEDGDASVRE